MSLFHRSKGYTGANERSMRMRDEAGAWDARMDDEEHDVTEYRGAPQGIKEAVLGRGREQDLRVGREDFQVEDRGRARNRGAEVYAEYGAEVERGHGDMGLSQGKNPFEDDVRKKDGFGDVTTRPGRMSVDSERRSVFREQI
jgi:hypothetical protein